MSDRKLFSSGKFFVFNLVMVGLIVGFVLSMVTFGCSTKIEPKEKVEAQEASLQVPASIEQLQNSFRSVAQETLPVVVELRVVEVVKQSVPQGRGWPWDFLFPEQNGSEGESQEREYRSQGLGSGVIVENDGDTHYVLTNDHVAGKAEEIVVVLNDGREFPAKLVGGDDRMDLAVVAFETDEEIPIAQLGDSDALEVGDWVLAVGSPFGFVSSVTAGIVSAKGRSGPQNNISDFIQTDAAINRGNSGGALVNIYGEVVGINTWIAAPSGGSVGLGFSIPINNAKKAITDLIDKGEIEYGWLGVNVSDILPLVEEDLDLENRNGAFIHNVYIGSPAEKGGIRPGDYVIAIDGQKVNSRDELVRTVGRLTAGSEVDFTVIRDGEELTETVTIGRREDSAEIAKRASKLWPGITVVPLADEIREEMELPSGEKGIVAAAVEQGTKAYVAGIRPYDIIYRINDTQIRNISDFYRAINDEASEELKIYYKREGSEFFAGIVR